MNRIIHLKVKFFAAAVLALFLVQNISCWAAVPPVDPNASPATRKLLEYIAALPTKHDHRVISGQMLGLADDDKAIKPLEEYANGYRDYVEGLKEKTGKWVGLIGTNYGRNGACPEKNTFDARQGSPWLNCDGRPASFHKVNKILIDYWKAGGLVTIMWHAPNPWTGQGPHDNRIPGNFADLYTPGTPMNLTWHKMLDDIAGGLDELQQAGLVVLFRPLHEQNGNWFWWGYHGEGGHPTAAEFASLWKDTFRYLSGVKKLNNLLWVFSPNRPAEGQDMLVFNPGKEFFDIVGIDSYEDKWSKPIPYSQLTSLGKPLAIAEFGPTPEYAKDPATKGKFDWMRLSDILHKYPGFCYFMSWYGNSEYSESLDQNKNVNKLLDDPIIDNRGDILWR